MNLVFGSDREAMRRRKFINLNRFWNNPAATTLVLS
jgi:hypothetical protein